MSPTRQQPPQQPPPVQRMRVRYCKRGRARFTSHRDVARALERALRRAGVPMAYSSGFNPHPRISYAGASATGAATEADYLELGLAERREPAWLIGALTAALPDGIDVLDAVEWTPGGPDGRSLSERLGASRWRADLPEASRAALTDAVPALLDADEAWVERLTKNGVRRFDARGAILELVPDGAALTMVLVQGSPLVRPDDVVLALAQVAHLASEAQPGGSVLFTRLQQGDWRDGELADPLR